MKALKTCKTGTFKQIDADMNITYKIKGIRPNGRCEVEFTSFTDLTNKTNYENYKNHAETGKCAKLF